MDVIPLAMTRTEKNVALSTGAQLPTNVLKMKRHAVKQPDTLTLDLPKNTIKISTAAIRETMLTLMVFQGKTILEDAVTHMDLTLIAVEHPRVMRNLLPSNPMVPAKLKRSHPALVKDAVTSTAVMNLTTSCTEPTKIITSRDTVINHSLNSTQNGMMTSMTGGTERTTLDMVLVMLQYTEGDTNNERYIYSCGLTMTY